MTKENGFTLIEVAIILLISGILLASGIMAYDLYSKNQRYAKTWENMELIRNALAEYQIKTGNYPCPADPTKGPQDTNYGVANCTPCAGCVVTSNRDADGVGGNDSIIIGSVPLTTLITTVYSDGATQAKISINEIHDGWNNKIMYAVSESLAKDTFKPNYGVIDMVDENNQPLLDTPSTAHYVLISYGEDGVGAYGRNGGPRNACTAGEVQTRNCTLGNQFVSGLLSLAAGAGHYDDLVQFVTWSMSKMWSYSPNNPGTIYNTNLGFVGMGTDAPAVQLDIGGRIRATNLYTRLFCDDKGENCYDPEKIGGTDITMDCDDDSMAVKQIGVRASGSNATLKPLQPSVGCEKPFPSAAALNKKCPIAGQYMYGYTTRNGGEPLCK